MRACPRTRRPRRTSYYSFAPSPNVTGGASLPSSLTTASAEPRGGTSAHSSTRLLRGVARREFDMIAAWSVDRLGRSLQDLLSFLLELQSKRVDLYLHQQALDTSTPMGKAMFQLCGVFAELERSIIQERVRAGLERARAKGKILGRPRTDPKVEATIRKLAGQGMGKGKIARTLGIGVSVAQRVLAVE